MSLTYTVTKAINDGTSTLSKQETFTCEGDKRIDLTTTGATTNMQMDCALTRTLIKCLYFYADSACTLKTNTTAGTDSFTLVANEPVIWDDKMNGLAITELLSADVTTLYLTAATTTSFRLRAGMDATP